MRSLISGISVKSDSKIMMCVLDGLGGLPVNGKTELQSAKTPNLDKLARAASCGLHTPVAPGITPGSGAAHLGLFGYDPLFFKVGRGAVEAAGLNIKTGKNDLVARGNFATVETQKRKTVLTDRRAGRISTKHSTELVSQISASVKKIGNVKIKIYPGLEHRFVVVFTFPHPVTDAERICDTDPQREGLEAPLVVKTDSQNKKTIAAARTIQRFSEKAQEVLGNRKTANCVLLRGFSAPPNLETFGKTYGLKAACVAAYPMYRGIAQIAGMDIKNPAGGKTEQIIRRAEEIFSDFDFVYLHIKSTDRHGEDGNFKDKARAISEFDKFVPRLLKLAPDVLIVTGDHSTPASMSSHSWHPVPLLIKSRHSIGGKSGFNEMDCRAGELGIIRAVEIMPLALAHAGRLAKFGA
ncbi:2,3-bisphosphoglycerate-independent phosphoglycerate mutase [Candidatus Mycalebacterium sp.]